MKRFLALIVIAVMVFGAGVLSACGNAYAKVNLVPSTNNLEIEVGETTSFSVGIENYFNNMSNQIAVNSDGELVEVCKIEYANNGVANVEILGLKVGEGSLHITTLEGGKSCVVGIKVSQPVKSFELKTTPYLIKQAGLNYNFSSLNWFSFSPINATKTKVSYYFNNNGTSEKIVSAKTIDDAGALLTVLVTDAGKEISMLATSFSLTAKLDAYPDVNALVFDVDIIEPIQTTGVSIIKQGLYNTNYIPENQRTPLNQNSIVTLISNNYNSSYFEFEIGVLTSGVSVEIMGTKTESNHVIPNSADFTPATSNSYVFGLQARELGEDVIKIKLFYKNYEGYEITLSFKVKAFNAPTSIYVNDKTPAQSLAESIILYDENYGETAIKQLNLAVYSTDSAFDSVAVEVLQAPSSVADATPLANWSEYITLTYKNQIKTSNFAIAYSDFAHNYLNSALTIVGKKIFAGKIFLKFTLNSSLVEENSIVHFVPIIIKEGATKFEVSTSYQNGLSVDLNKGEQLFGGLVVESKNAHIGTLAFEYLGNSNFLFQVKQVTQNEKAITIKPLAAGQGRVKITLPNGLPVTLAINVQVALETVNLSALNSEFISKVEFDDSENVSGLAVNFTLDPAAETKRIDLDLRLITNPTTATLFNVQHQIVAGDDIISFNPNTFKLSVFGVGNASLQITIFRAVVENFSVVGVTGEENGIVFNINIVSFSPITSLQYKNAGTAGENQNAVNAVSVYKSGDVGYYYSQRGYSAFELDLTATLWNGNQPADLFNYYKGKISWATQLGEPSEESSSSTGVFASEGTIPNFGQYSIKGNRLSFVCDNTYAQAGTSFWIAFTITEFSYSVTAVLNVSVLEYTPLTYVGFYNYQNEIYLSDENKNFVFNTFLNPEADCQEYDVFFVPSDNTASSLISATVNASFSQILIHYNGTGTGKGHILIVPKTSYINETAFTYYQSVAVFVSDGSDKENPLPISTAQGFINVMSDANSLAKHYKITTTLDFDGLVIPCFGQLRGSVVGESGSAKLINLNISKTLIEGSNTYLGLFSKIAETGEIKNIAFEGKISYNAQTNNNLFAGLIAAENLGNIENVSVLLAKSDVLVENLDEIYSGAEISVGGVVGVNRGAIINYVNKSAGTANHTLINQTNVLKATYKGYSQNTSLGGVAGVNFGVISRLVNQNTSLYNSSIYSVRVNLSSVGFCATGAVVGKNQKQSINLPFASSFANSTISNMIIDGLINADKFEINVDKSVGGINVGGVVGVNNCFVLNNITRVFVSGFDYVGGIAGKDNTIEGFISNPTAYNFVSENSVQAVYLTSFKYMLTAISNAGNVGAIAGNENSTINEKLYALTNQAQYFYESNISSKVFPVAYSKIGNSYEFIKHDDTKPYYSLFQFKDVIVEVERIENDLTLGAGKLETENTAYDNLVAYMFYYGAENTVQQKYLSKQNTARDVPFIFKYPDSVNISSLNREILNIDSNGKINVYGTGTAVLQITSALNNTKGSTYLYVVVTNAFNSYTIHAANNSVVTNGSTIVVYQNAPIELNYNFNHSGISASDDYNQPIKVQLLKNTEATLNYKINEATEYVQITNVGNSLIFSIGGVVVANASNTITFVPVFNLFLPNIGNVHMGYGNELTNQPSEMDNLITETTSKTSIIALAKKGTERFEIGFSFITVEPLDVIDVKLKQITDYENDTLKISFIKVGDAAENFDYFIIEQHDGYLTTNENGFYLYKGAAGNFKFVFNYAKYALNGQNYSGTYYINFVADNGASETIIVNVIKQEVANILLKNYYNVLGTINKASAEENFVAAGASSVLQIDVYPYFADFDYITVNNAPENNTNKNYLVLEVVYEDKDGKLQTVYGVEYTAEGVKIPLRVIKEYVTSATSAQIFVRYTTTSSATENSKSNLIVSAVKNVNVGGVATQQVQFKTTKTINVIVKDTVEFKIRGKQAVNGKYYVAKGLSYDLDLVVHGFSTNQIVTQSTSPYAEIRQQTDGSYKLQISPTINYVSGREGYELTISTFGQTVVDGLYYTSDKVELNLVIVDYVLLLENLKPLDLSAENLANYTGATVVQNAENGLLRVAIGNTTPLAVKLANGLSVEYDANSTAISNAIKNFEKSLTRNAEWGINAKQIGIAGPYITKTIFKDNVYINNQFLRISSEVATGGIYTYSYAPLKLTSAQSALYNLTFNASFKYLNGVPMVSSPNDLAAFSLATDVAIEVYATGQENNAIPIYTYDDLLNMQEGLWYNQLANITLPADFVPLSTAIAGLNGNGFSFSFENMWRTTGVGAVGLFGTLPSGSVLKNIKMHISQSLNVVISNTTAVNFGFLAGVNNGTITNCSVVSDATVNVAITGQLETITENYVAGIAGYNSGYITHSQVKLNLVAIGNVAGLAGVNENTISSSYVSESKLTNNSGDVANHTAGFVVRNGLTPSSTNPAIIQNCYVSGAFSSNNVYSSGTDKIINSKTQVAGFVFDNYSKISNCYANVPIYSNSVRAGFVFRNAGQIENAYSTSTFGTSGQTAYGFLVFNKIDEFQGKIFNSFYLLGTVNSTVNKTTFEGVTSLSEIEFSLPNVFQNFIISTSTYKTGGIWFYPSRTVEPEFVVDGRMQQFIYGKPELVAPNLIATSQKSLDSENITVDPATGQTTYVYVETKNAEGSMFNPHTIYSATEFETVVLAGNNRNVNNNYFRIVSDIDYVAQNVYNSTLYKTVFKGDIEGNGMTIMGYVIDTKESLTSGGLFAKVGSGNTGEGMVRNLTLAPKYINMPNTSYVGALAGSLESGSLFNVSVLGFEYDRNGLVIIGHYAVGGVVGVAINNFKINNVSSSISARASYDSSLENEKVGIFTTSKTTKISYAGAIIGAANNTGEIVNAAVMGKVASMAEIAGLMFGKLGTNVNVSNINLQIISGQFVRATAYGGIIAGELCGTLKNVQVSGEADASFFKISPTVPKVIGGVVGFMQTGKLENISIKINLVWPVSSPSVVGGVVGEMLGGTLKDIDFTGSVNLFGNTQSSAATSLTVGGIVGRANYQPSVNASSQLKAGEINLINCKTLTSGKLESGNIKIVTDSLYRVSVGGIVGESILNYETYRFNDRAYCRVGNPLTINGCQNNLNITINSTIFDGTYYGNLGGLIGGSYAGANKTYAGEAIIFDDISMQEINDLYASQSHAKLVISVKNMKKEGAAILKYGGIIGFGWPVSSTTAAEGTPTTKTPFGALLESATKQTTAPSYDGQYKVDSEGKTTPILRMQDSGFLTLPSDSAYLNLVLEQNNYWNKD